MTTKVAVNEHGRRFDDLDAIKLRVFARDVVPPEKSFSVYTCDGLALCGEHVNESSESIQLIASNWRTKGH